MSYYRHHSERKHVYCKFVTLLNAVFLDKKCTKWILDKKW